MGCKNGSRTISPRCGQMPGLDGIHNTGVRLLKGPAEGLAFLVARFVQNNGSYLNFERNQKTAQMLIKLTPVSWRNQFRSNCSWSFCCHKATFNAPEGNDPLRRLNANRVVVSRPKDGTVYGNLDHPKLTYNGNVNLRAGINKISLLSVAVGLPNVGVHYERWNTGVLGPITLSGLNEGTRDLTKQTWSYKVGLKGESLSLATVTGSSSVEWVEGSLLTQKQPLTWYKATFNAPEGNDPLAIDMNGMGKGEIWINGESIGRHWPGYIAKGGCGECNYAGTYKENKCQQGCGQPSQRWYHIPRSWVKSTGNLLVVFEELGGDPTKMSLVKRTV